MWFNLYITSKKYISKIPYEDHKCNKEFTIVYEVIEKKDKDIYESII